jgi:hypothetical protein
MSEPRTLRPFVFLDIVAYASVRDESGRLLRSEEQRVVVSAAVHLNDAVLEIVQKYWPTASAEDVVWSKPPTEWDGVEALRWTTCAEVDGAVTHRLQ